MLRLRSPLAFPQRATRPAVITPTPKQIYVHAGINRCAFRGFAITASLEQAAVLRIDILLCICTSLYVGTYASTNRTRRTRLIRLEQPSSLIAKERRNFYADDFRNYASHRSLGVLMAGDFLAPAALPREKKSLGWLSCSIMRCFTVIYHDIDGDDKE